MSDIVHPCNQGKGSTMKCIGLIGATGWESTQQYFKIINEEVGNRLGGLASAQCLVYSFNYQEVANLQTMEAWHTLGLRMGMAAASLEHAGADLLVIATHSMYKIADFVESAVRIPLVHIAEAAADELTRHKVSRVAVLGNASSLEEVIFSETFKKKGMEIIPSEPSQRESLVRILMSGEFSEKWSGDPCRKLSEIICSFQDKGAQGVLVDTTIKDLFASRPVPLPLFDSIAIHAAAAVNQAFQ